MACQNWISVRRLRPDGGGRGEAEGRGPGQQGTALHGVISPIVGCCGGW